MIRLNCFISAPEQYMDEIIRLAKELTEESSKETGCIAYDIFASCTRPDVLMFCETWADEDSLSAHAKTPHFVRIVARIRQLAEMKLEKFNF